MEQAIQAYTKNSAYARFADKRLGTLEPGKYADLVVLSQDIFTAAPMDIGKTHPVITMVGGKIVYSQAYSRQPENPTKIGGDWMKIRAQRTDLDKILEPNPKEVILKIRLQVNESGHRRARAHAGDVGLPPFMSHYRLLCGTAMVTTSASGIAGANLPGRN